MSINLIYDKIVASGRLTEPTTAVTNLE